MIYCFYVQQHDLNFHFCENRGGGVMVEVEKYLTVRNASVCVRWGVGGLKTKTLWMNYMICNDKWSRTLVAASKLT